MKAMNFLAVALVLAFLVSADTVSGRHLLQNGLNGAATGQNSSGSTSGNISGRHLLSGADGGAITGQAGASSTTSGSGRHLLSGADGGAITGQAGASGAKSGNNSGRHLMSGGGSANTASYTSTDANSGSMGGGSSASAPMTG